MKKYTQLLFLLVLLVLIGFTIYFGYASFKESQAASAASAAAWNVTAHQMEEEQQKFSEDMKIIHAEQEAYTTKCEKAGGVPTNAGCLKKEVFIKIESSKL